MATFYITEALAASEWNALSTGVGETGCGLPIAKGGVFHTTGLICPYKGRTIKAKKMAEYMQKRYGGSIHPDLQERLEELLARTVPQPVRVDFLDSPGAVKDMIAGGENWPHTCISGKKRSKGLIYLHKRGILKGVIQTTHDERYGRALVWNLKDGRTFVDRVYPSDKGWQYDAVRDYAKDKGWLFRGIVNGEGGVGVATKDWRLTPGHPMEIEFPLPDKGLSLPYMDTLRFGRVDKAKGTMLCSDTRIATDVLVRTAIAAGANLQLADGTHWSCKCDICGDKVADDGLCDTHAIPLTTGGRAHVDNVQYIPHHNMVLTMGCDAADRTSALYVFSPNRVSERYVPRALVRPYRGLNVLKGGDEAYINHVLDNRYF